MALNIGNKVYRNLQEQVGYNSEQIDKIFSILDGIDYEDHVVVIEDITTPLDEDEMAIVREPVAFLVYQNKLYFKDSSDSDNYYFSAVIDIEGTNVISIRSFQIAVNISTGELEVLESSFETYSKDEEDLKITNLQTMISSIASGSPKGVYATLADLETAFPTGAEGIYVVSADGHWYYWSGSQWTDGGSYLSAPNVVYNDGNILRDYLGNNIYPDLFKRLNFINPSANITGGYYADNGSVTAEVNSTYNTDYIEVDGGKTIVWNIVRNIQICTYDEDKTFIERLSNLQTTLYLTLNNNVKYIRISAYNNTLNDLMLTYLDLYQAFVSYKGYINGKNILDNSLLYKSFKYGELESAFGTPVYLDHLDKTNYEYVDVGDGYLNDYGQFVSYVGYHTIYFVVKEEEITLWYNSTSGSSYFSICIANGNFGEQYAQVGVRYRVSDNNMPTEENPLTLKRGQIVGISFGSSNTNFNLGVSGVIGSYNIKPKFNVNIAKPIRVIKSGDNYSINFNNYTFDFLKLNIPATNLNSYDIYQVSKNGTIIEDGQLFCAVKEVGESDFMGGYDHGDDIMISMNILADGVPITENVDCDKVDIYLETYLQNVTDKHNVFKKYIHIIFENNTMKTDVSLVCLVNNFSLEVAYTGMWGQRKPFIDKILFNCIDYDISDAPTTLVNENIESSTYILNNPSGLVNIVNKENIKARIVHYDTESDQRVKTYFVIDNNKTLNENDCLKSSSVYYLN